MSSYSKLRNDHVFVNYMVLDSRLRNDHTGGHVKVKQDTLASCSVIRASIHALKVCRFDSWALSGLQFQFPDRLG